MTFVFSAKLVIRGVIRRNFSPTPLTEERAYLPRREAQPVRSGAGQGKRVWRLDHRSSERSAAVAESAGVRDATRGSKQTL